MTIDKIFIAKKIVTGAVGFGTTKIIRTIIANEVRPEKLLDKIVVTAGAIAVSSMIADQTRDYTDAKIEEMVEAVKKIMAGDDTVKVVSVPTV